METCNTIPDVEAEELKVNIEVAVDSACESTVLMCQRIEPPLIIDSTWSLC